MNPARAPNRPQKGIIHCENNLLLFADYEKASYQPYRLGRGSNASSHQISFEFLLVKKCPWTKSKIWFRLVSLCRIQIKSLILSRDNFWPKGIQKKFGGKWFLNPGLDGSSLYKTPLIFSTSPITRKLRSSHWAHFGCPRWFPPFSPQIQCLPDPQHGRGSCNPGKPLCTGCYALHSNEL
jgi:hypothetical protein